MPAQTQTHLVLPLQEDIDWPNYPVSPLLQAALFHHENTAAPYRPPALQNPYDPFQLCSQSALSYWSQLLLHPTWQRALTHPQGPTPLPPSSPRTSLPAHPLMLSSSSSSQLSVCKLLLRFFSLKPQAPYLIGTLSIPVSSGTWLPHPAEPQCLADRRKTSLPPMCTTPKMVSRPRREE